MSDNTRIIHTGLFSERAFLLISELISDLQNYYAGAKRTKKMASLFNTTVKHGIDNEIILQAHSKSYYYRRSRIWNDFTDNQVLRHVIWMYKLLIIKRAGNDSWKRGSTTTILRSDSDFKISEVYFLYDMFHQRNNFKRNYPDNYSDELIGIPLDPITVELKNTQLAEIEKIVNEKKCKIDKLKNQKYNERDEAYRAIEDKYAKLMNEAEAEAEAKIKQLTDELESISSLNLLANIG
jgi:hypothetical protein